MKLDQSLVHHCISDLEEAADVCTIDVVARCAKPVSGLDAGLVDALHDHM